MSNHPEFPYLILVGIVAFHVGFMTLVIVYICRKYKCCACSCFISCCSDELPEEGRETVIDINALRNPSTTHLSPDISRIQVMDPADPGMQHINRFLGRNPSDPGLQHINRFLGRQYFVNSNDNDNHDIESDIGMQHVRRALGMMEPERRSDTSDSRRTSAPTPVPRNIRLDTHRPSQSLQTLHNSPMSQDLNGNTQQLYRSRTDSAVARGRELTPQTSSDEDLSDQLPSYQEAITLFARQESGIDDEPPPPRYEDVINEDLESV